MWPGRGVVAPSSWTVAAGQSGNARVGGRVGVIPRILFRGRWLGKLLWHLSKVGLCSKSPLWGGHTGGGGVAGGG